MPRPAAKREHRLIAHPTAGVCPNPRHQKRAALVQARPKPSTHPPQSLAPGPLRAALCAPACTARAPAPGRCLDHTACLQGPQPPRWQHPAARRTSRGVHWLPCTRCADQQGPPGTAPPPVEWGGVGWRRRLRPSDAAGHARGAGCAECRGYAAGGEGGAVRWPRAQRSHCAAAARHRGRLAAQPHTPATLPWARANAAAHQKHIPRAAAPSPSPPLDRLPPQPHLRAPHEQLRLAVLDRPGRPHLARSGGRCHYARICGRRGRSRGPVCRGRRRQGSGVGAAAAGWQPLSACAGRAAPLATALCAF